MSPTGPGAEGDDHRTPLIRARNPETGAGSAIHRPGTYSHIRSAALVTSSVSTIALAWWFWQPGIVTFLVSASLVVLAVARSAARRKDLPLAVLAQSLPTLVYAPVASAVFCLGAFDPQLGLLAGGVVLLSAPEFVRRTQASLRRERAEVAARRDGRPGPRNGVLVPRGHDVPSGSDNPAGDRHAWPSPVDAFGELLRSYDDAELCRVWNRSYGRLHDDMTAVELERLAAVRQLYLDEWERRDPAGLSAWLESSPRPTVDLTPHRDRRPPSNP